MDREFSKLRNEPTKREIYTKLLDERVDSHWASMPFNGVTDEDGYLHGFLHGGVIIEFSFQNDCTSMTVQASVYDHEEKEGSNDLETMDDKLTRLMNHPDNKSLIERMQSADSELVQNEEKEQLVLVKRDIPISYLETDDGESFDALVDDTLALAQDMRKALTEEPVKKLAKAMKRTSFSLRRSMGPGVLLGDRQNEGAGDQKRQSFRKKRLSFLGRS